MKDKDNNIIFQAKGGDVICNSGTFKNVKISGELNGVTGTFRELVALVDDGSGYPVKGAGIRMEGVAKKDGRLIFDGNMDNRGQTFYGGNVFSTGYESGVRGRNILFVKDNMYTLLQTGYYDTPTFGLGDPITDGNVSFYPVPLMIDDGVVSVENKPIDVVVFNCEKSLYYLLDSECIGKGVDIINANDETNIYIASQIGWYCLGGGASMRGVYVGNGTANLMGVNVINPIKKNIGAGWFFFGEKDFNWS